MAKGIPYIPGQPVERPQPLGRFLPPLPEGVAPAWLDAHLPHRPGTRPAWIIDPFGASPQLAVEIARQGYPVLVAANNPITRFLLELAAQPPTAAGLRAALAELAGAYKGDLRMEPHLRSLYLTHCAACGNEVMAGAFLWEREAAAPYAKNYTCPVCGDSGERPADEKDAERARLDRSGLNRARALERVAPLDDPDRPYAEEAIGAYLPRAVYVLLTLINKLENLSAARRDQFAVLLLAAFDQGHNLWPVGGGRPRPRQLVTPPRFIEHNLWLALEAAVEGWSHPQDSPVVAVPLTIWPEQPPPGGGICIFEGRVKSLGEPGAGLPDLQAAAVLAALPRPNQAFWTLSALWAGWLWGAEATAAFKRVLRRRRYDWAWHSTALHAALRPLAPLLERGTPFFGLLGETEPGFLAAALIAAGKAGFDLDGIALRHGTGLAQISWRQAGRPLPALPEEEGGETEPGEELEKKDELSTAEMRRLAERSGAAYLQKRGEPAAYPHLHAAALAALAESGELAGNDQPPARVLNLVQNAVQHAFTQGPGFVRFGGSGRAPESGLYGLVNDPPEAQPLADQVEMWVVRFLLKHPGCSPDEIDHALCGEFPGLLTPAPELLAACLDSYGQRTPAGGWELAAPDTPARRRSDLEEIAALLTQTGQRLQWEPAPSADWNITWREPDGEAAYVFHIQASALLGPRPTAGVIVHPDERLSLLAFKLENNPRWGQAARQSALQGWRFLTYSRLRRLASEPGLTRAGFEEQLGLDPLTGSSEQMQLL